MTLDNWVARYWKKLTLQYIFFLLDIIKKYEKIQQMHAVCSSCTDIQRTLSGCARAVFPERGITGGANQGYKAK